MLSAPDIHSNAYASYLVITAPIVLGKNTAYDDIERCMGWGMANTAWEARVKGLLKGELKRRGVSYNQLVEKLAAIGVNETEPNIRNKLARGKFTAVFLLQCLEAVGAKSFQLADR